jgi:hypothetical protein
MAQAAASGRFSKEDFRTFTLALANRLAERDKRSIGKQEAKKQAHTYGMGQKKLKDFEKAYLKAWGFAN